MKRTEQREHIFKMVFGLEFNEETEMSEQMKLYFEQLEDAKEKDLEYIQTKAGKIAEKTEEIECFDQFPYKRMEDQPHEQGGSYDLKTGGL